MSIFDGVTGLFEGVFTDAVTLTLEGGATRVAQGIFREEPVVRSDTDGAEVLTVEPMLKLRAADAEGVVRDSAVTVRSRVFKIGAGQPTRSPAADRHVMFFLVEEAPA